MTLQRMALLGIAQQESDPYFSSVALLLHGNGANGSTVFTDSSSSPKIITAVGNAQITTSNSIYNGSSMAFDGAGDGLTINTSIVIGANDFTVESWVYNAKPTTNDLARYFLISTSNANLTGGMSLFWNSPSQYIFRVGGMGGDLIVAAHSLNTWTHVAVTRSAGVNRIFFNGILQGTLNQTLQNLSSPLVNIGTTLQYGSSYDLLGNLAEIRVTIGIARYTASFIPPSAPFPDL